MRVTLFRLLGALTLGVLALAVSSGRFTPPTFGSSVSPSGDWVAAAGLSSQHVSPPATDASSRSSVQQGGSGPSGCDPYDSWCGYCTRQGDPAVCNNFPYKTGGTAATKATATPTAPAAATPTPTAKPS